jgi:hypothetical protein
MESTDWDQRCGIIYRCGAAQLYDIIEKVGAHIRTSYAVTLDAGEEAQAETDLRRLPSYADATRLDASGKHRPDIANLEVKRWVIRFGTR